jgi:hypothetical protein
MTDRTLHLTPKEYVVIRSKSRDALEVEGTQPLVLGALRVLGAVGRLLGKRASRDVSTALRIHRRRGFARTL